MSRKCSKVKLTDKCLVVPDPNFLSLMHIHALHKHFYIGAKVLPSSCVRNTRVDRGSVCYNNKIILTKSVSMYCE